MVLNGSLLEAAFRAILATALEDTWSSKIIELGFKTCTHWWTFPFPFPILTSWGFFVKDWCGNTLWMIFPFLFRALLIVRVIASSCEAVIKDGSVVTNAYCE